MYHGVGITEDEKYLTLYASTGTDGFEMYLQGYGERWPA